MCILKWENFIIPSLSKEYIVGGPIWAGMNFFFIKTRTRITPHTVAINYISWKVLRDFKTRWEPVDLKR
jgi:hypothetical protein